MSAWAKSGSSGANEARPSGRSGKTSPTPKTEMRPSTATSEREERRLVLALEVDLEAQRALRRPRHQERAVLLGNEPEHGVGAVRLRLVGEVDARQRLLEQPAREDGDVEVRRLDTAVRGRRRLGLAHDDRVGAVLVGARARPLLAVPELEEALRPRHRGAVAVEDNALDPHGA